jgi:putative membrane protein
MPLRALLTSQFLRTGFVTATLGAAVAVAAAAAGGRPVGAVLVVGALVGVAGFVFRNFATLHGFTLRGSPQGLRITSGLLGVRSQTVPTGRVQGLVLIEPLLWRGLGWVRVDVTVAGARRAAGEDGEQLASTLVPVAPRADAVALASRVLGADPTVVALDGPPGRAGWLAPLTRRRLRAGLDSGLVVTTRGLFTMRTDVVPRAKIQSVRLSQGPLQRWLRLASVRFDLPSGPVSALAAHRDQGAAWQLAGDVVDAGGHS